MRRGHKARMEPGWKRRDREFSRPDLGRCERTPHKARFTDEGRAREATTRHHYSKPLYVYRCPTCKGWHLTSRPQRTP